MKLSNTTPADDDIELEVVERRPLTAEVIALRLQRADRGTLPAAAPGAHVKVLAMVGTDAVQRCYSIVNAGQDTQVYEVAIKLEPAGEGASRFMHQIGVGQHLTSSGPRHDFALVSQPHEAILIAGGIGITPIYAMAIALQATGADYTLHYGARTPDLMAYRQEVERFCGNRAHLYFDNGVAAQGMQLQQLLDRPSRARHVYACGPKPLVDAVLHEAKLLGWDPDHIHFELFGAAAPASGDRPVSVTLARSGRTIEVPARVSILDAMIAAGCDPMFDCKRGECSVCALNVLEGIADHRDYVLSDEDKEDGLLCVCVSRARTPHLTLDA